MSSHNYLRTRNLPDSSRHVARTLLNKRDAEAAAARAALPKPTFVPPPAPSLQLGITFKPGDFSGCYALIDRFGDVAYVGTSSNVIARVETHKRNEEIPFESACYWLLSDKDRKQVEYDMIRVLRPPHNKANNHNWPESAKDVIKRIERLRKHNVLLESDLVQRERN